MVYDPPPWADKRSYDEGFEDGGDSAIARIRSAMKQRCGHAPFGWTAGVRCGLNKGHIGGCSPVPDTISITRERLEAILDG